MNDESQITPNSGGVNGIWAPAYRDTIADSALTDLSFRLLMLLMTYAVGKDKCWPSLVELCEKLPATRVKRRNLKKKNGRPPGRSRTQVIRALKDLETAGYIIKESHPGRVTTYRLMNRNRPVRKNELVEFNPFGKTDQGNSEKRTTLVRNSEHVTREKKDIKEKQKEPASSSARKKSAPRDQSLIQQHLSSLDIDKHRAKWADKIDFDDALETFKEVALHGTAQKPGPNPYDWKDFNLALDQWCRKRNGWKPQAALKDNQATYDYPKLADYQY